MINNIKESSIFYHIKAKSALKKLDNLKSDKILFLTKKSGQLVGSLTDGDIRRGLLAGLSINDSIDKFANLNPKYIFHKKFSKMYLDKLRKLDINIIPILDSKKRIINLINLNNQIGYIPVEAIVLAGGFGTRLGALTKNTPKPLIKVKNKPIINYGIDRLKMFGVSNFHFCLFHMKEKIKKHIEKNYSDININFIQEKKPLGTIGAVSLIKKINQDYVLIMNADILSTIDFQKFFDNFIHENADMAVATIPHTIKIPYAVTNVLNNEIISLDEKPTYTYQSNAAIYLVKKSILKLIPKNKKFDATDLISLLINNKKYKVLSYELNEYWSDIGSVNDLDKTKKDVLSLKI